MSITKQVSAVPWLLIFPGEKQPDFPVYWDKRVI